MHNTFCLNLDFQDLLDSMIMYFFSNHGNRLILSNHGSRLFV
jgi:hypothetical protein